MRVLALCLIVTACAERSPAAAAPDAAQGTLDGSATDAAAGDAAPADGRGPDAAGDARTADAPAPPDAAPPDGTRPDGSSAPIDARPPDAAPPDAVSPDAAVPPDAAPPDVPSPPDAAPADAARTCFDACSLADPSACAGGVLATCATGADGCTRLTSEPCTSGFCAGASACLACDAPGADCRVLSPAEPLGVEPSEIALAAGEDSVVAAWNPVGSGDVVAARYLEGAGWQAAEPVDSDGTGRGSLALAVNAGGQGLLAWRDADDRIVAATLDGDGWSPPETMATFTGYCNGYTDTPLVAVNEAGLGAVVWSAHNQFNMVNCILANVHLATGWLHELTLVNGFDLMPEAPDFVVGRLATPQLAVAPDDGMRVLMDRFPYSGDDPTSPGVWAYERPPGEDFSTSPTVLHSYLFDSDVPSLGALLPVSDGDMTAFYYRYGLRALRVLDADLGATSESLGGSFALRVARAGDQVLLGWLDIDEAGALSVLGAAGDALTLGFSTPERLDLGLHSYIGPFPSVATDAAGNGWLLWGESSKDSDYFLYLRRYRPGLGWSAARLVAAAPDIWVAEIAALPDGTTLLLWRQDGQLWASTL